jgi:hypothetical protein
LKSGKGKSREETVEGLIEFARLCIPMCRQLTRLLASFEASRTIKLGSKLMQSQSFSSKLSESFPVNVSSKASLHPQPPITFFNPSTLLLTDKCQSFD